MLCVGHLAEQIEEFAGNGSAFELQLILWEECSYWGWWSFAQSIASAWEDFFVLYGDSWLKSITEVLRAFKVAICLP